MAIVHIVQFKFKDSVQAAGVSELCSKFLALKDKCVHPETGKPYIMNISGGKNNSPENFNDGLTHAFVSIFDNEEDRNYYLHKDPVHLDFAASAGDVVEKLVVVDYEPNEF